MGSNNRINIVSSSRTGSSYLFNTVRAAFGESIYSFAEPFADHFSYADWIAEVNKLSSYKSSVVKNHYIQLNDLHNYDQNISKQFWSHNWKNILILRKDIFQQALSLSIAKKMNDYTGDTYDKTLKMYIDPIFFSKTLNNCIESWNLIIKNDLNINYSHKLYYEDLSFIPLYDLKKLGILPKLKIGNVKTEKTPDKVKIITNYTELKEYTKKVIDVNSLISQVDQL